MVNASATSERTQYPKALRRKEDGKAKEIDFVGGVSDADFAHHADLRWMP
jgi:hypothetical protein